MTRSNPPPSDCPRIGPNAVIQLAASLRAVEGERRTREIFASCGLEHYLDTPPAGMVAEDEVAHLHAAMAARLDPAIGHAVLFIAGQRTGAYLLAHRIPAPARVLLRLLPQAWGRRLLGWLIARHGWTFAGSRQVAISHAPRTVLSLENPRAGQVAAELPACRYFAATLESLFAGLIAHTARVVETECSLEGAAACCFELRIKKEV